MFNLYILRMGYGPGFIGLVSAVGSIVVAIVCLMISTLERRWGTRDLIITGLILNITASLLTPLADLLPLAWQQGWILAINGLNAVGQALYLVNSTPFLAALSGDKERGHVFSVQSAIWPLNGFIGSVIAGFLPLIFSSILHTSIGNPGPFRFALLVSGAASLLGLWTMLKTQPRSIEPHQSTRFQLKAAPLGIITLISLLVAFQVAGEWTARLFTNVYFDAGLKLPTSQIGVLMGIGQLVAVPAALITPLLAGRAGNKLTFIGASIGMALCLLPLGLMPVWTAAGLGYMGVIMMASIARPAIQTIQMEVVSPSWRAAMASATTLTASLSMGVVSYLGGLIIPSLGYPFFFSGGAILTTFAAVFYLVYSRLSRSLR